MKLKHANSSFLDNESFAVSFRIYIPIINVDRFLGIEYVCLKIVVIIIHYTFAFPCTFDIDKYLLGWMLLATLYWTEFTVKGYREKQMDNNKNYFLVSMMIMTTDQNIERIRKYKHYMQSNTPNQYSMTDCQATPQPVIPWLQQVRKHSREEEISRIWIC